MKIVMITLFFQHGHIMVYKVEDWITLRKTYRIIGEVIGTSTHIPSLPAKITPEEALLLMNRGIVEIREVIKCTESNQVSNFESELLDYQIVDYQKTRKVQLESVLDIIVEQKRINNDIRSKEEILEDEINKSSPVTKENMIWPIFLINNFKKEHTQLISLAAIKSFTTVLKYKTFESLYDEGYYVTGGTKFGGDFLVYFGDPICFHAIFIIKCIERDQKMSTMEMVAFGRIGTSVKKLAVLASMIYDEITYLTINWIDA